MPPCNKPPRALAALFMIAVVRRCLHHLALELIGDFSTLGITDAELTVCSELLLQECVPLYALLGHDSVLGDCATVEVASGGVFESNNVSGNGTLSRCIVRTQIWTRSFEGTSRNTELTF